MHFKCDTLQTGIQPWNSCKPIDLCDERIIFRHVISSRLVCIKHQTVSLYQALILSSPTFCSHRSGFIYFSSAFNIAFNFHLGAYSRFRPDGKPLPRRSLYCVALLPSNLRIQLSWPKRGSLDF